MRARLRHGLALGAALTALLLVFAAYTRPEFLVMLADVVSACF